MNNKGDEIVDNKSKFLSSAENMHSALGPAMCLAKWKQVSLHLTTGQTNSCYHPPLHAIDDSLLTDNPGALHNTPYKKEQRKIMLKQERPQECGYCWAMEDNNKLSDRHYRSGEPWAAKDFDSIMSSTGDEDVLPSYVEVNFNNVCNLACSSQTQRQSFIDGFGLATFGRARGSFYAQVSGSNRTVCGPSRFHHCRN